MPSDRVDAITEQWGRERPDLDVSPMHVFGRITRAAGLIQKELETVFSRYELMRGDFDVLATLRRSGEPYRLTPGRLSRSSMWSTGGMTKLLDRLEARDLVRREPDPDDRRGRLIALTPAGRRLADEVLELHVRNMERLYAGLSERKRTQLAGLLRELLLALEGAPEG